MVLSPAYMIYVLSVTVVLGETQVHHKVRLISWTDNPPYYLSEHFQTDRRHRGIILSALRSAHNICGVTIMQNISDNEEDHLQEHGDLINLLQQSDTEIMLRSKNISRKDNELIVFGASSFQHPEKINKNFTVKTIMLSPGIAVIVNSEDTSLLMKFFRAINNCLIFIYFAFIMSVFVAFFIWIFEHHTNPKVPNSFGRGLWHCFWFSIVTMTTVGYGDYIIRHTMSRVITICWMIFGVLITAMITATVLEEIQKTVHTTNHSIAVLENTTEVDLIPRYLNGHPMEMKSYESVLEAVRDKRAKAGVIDSNIAALYFNKYSPAHISIERFIPVRIPVNIFVLTYGTNCHNADLVREELMESIKTSYIAPLHPTPYQVPSMWEIFDKAENGLIFYCTTAAACMVIIAITTECYIWIQKEKEKKTSRLLHCVDSSTKEDIIAKLEDLIRIVESDACHISPQREIIENNIDVQTNKLNDSV